jgi:hypothetical protein
VQTFNTWMTSGLAIISVVLALLVLSPSVHLWDQVDPQTNDIMNRTGPAIAGMRDQSTRTHLDNVHSLLSAPRHMPSQLEARGAPSTGMAKPTTSTGAVVPNAGPPVQAFDTPVTVTVAPDNQIHIDPTVSKGGAAGASTDTNGAGTAQADGALQYTGIAPSEWIFGDGLYV